MPPKECYSEETAQSFCRTIIDTIEYVHDQNIVHCDIKPESFLLAHPGDERSIKLRGFGAARSLDHGPVISPVRFDEELMAPEILEGKPHDTVRFISLRSTDSQVPLLEGSRTFCFSCLSLRVTVFFCRQYFLVSLLPS